MGYGMGKCLQLRVCLRELPGSLRHARFQLGRELLELQVGRMQPLLGRLASRDVTVCFEYPEGPIRPGPIGNPAGQCNDRFAVAGRVGQLSGPTSDPLTDRSRVLQRNRRMRLQERVCNPADGFRGRKAVHCLRTFIPIGHAIVRIADHNRVASQIQQARLLARRTLPLAQVVQRNSQLARIARDRSISAGLVRARVTDQECRPINIDVVAGLPVPQLHLRLRTTRSEQRRDENRIVKVAVFLCHISAEKDTAIIRLPIKTQSAAGTGIEVQEAAVEIRQADKVTALLDELNELLALTRE